MMVFNHAKTPPWPEWRNWQTRQLEGLVRNFSGAGSSPVSGITCGSRLLMLALRDAIRGTDLPCELARTGFREVAIIVKKRLFAVHAPQIDATYSHVSADLDQHIIEAIHCFGQCWHGPKTAIMAPA